MSEAERFLEGEGWGPSCPPRVLHFHGLAWFSAPRQFLWSFRCQARPRRSTDDGETFAPILPLQPRSSSPQVPMWEGTLPGVNLPPWGTRSLPSTQTLGARSCHQPSLSWPYPCQTSAGCVSGRAAYIHISQGYDPGERRQETMAWGAKVSVSHLRVRMGDSHVQAGFPWEPDFWMGFWRMYRSSSGGQGEKEPWERGSSLNKGTEAWNRLGRMWGARVDKKDISKNRSSTLPNRVERNDGRLVLASSLDLKVA